MPIKLKILIYILYLIIYPYVILKCSTGELKMVRGPPRQWPIPAIDQEFNNAFLFLKHQFCG